MEHQKRGLPWVPIVIVLLIGGVCGCGVVMGLFGLLGYRGMQQPVPEVRAVDDMQPVAPQQEPIAIPPKDVPPTP